MKRIVFLLTVTLFFAFVCSAQQNDPIGCATPQSKSIGFLVGTWKVKSKFRTNRRENKWETTEAVSKIDHLFRDCVYKEVLTGKRNGRFHEFAGLYSYSNISNKLQWVGGHSEHGVLALYEGNLEGDILELKNEIEIRGRKFYLRRVLNKTGSGFTVSSERSVDGKTWDASWQLEYVRIE